jgi:hypothetical protein
MSRGWVMTAELSSRLLQGADAVERQARKLDALSRK